MLDHVYGVGADIEEKVVEVYISRLRQRLKDHGVLIQARRGLGYHITVQGARMKPSSLRARLTLIILPLCSSFR